MENLSKILLSLFLLTSCTVTWIPEESYHYEDHQHSTEIYWDSGFSGLSAQYANHPYWGYHSGFYYYYGIPHYYPWWYYYQFLPPYHYHTHTHVHIHCNNGYYVYHGHRKNKFNNQKSGNYKASTSIITNKIKTNTFPRDWKSNNSTRINKQNNVKYNTNKINFNRIFNGNTNTNKINNKYNNNFNINKNYNNKIKVNNGSKRSNKTNTSRRTKK